ncbi:MAG: spore coat U domain-containing protein [Proteobacteria bacterium]|nr:spore coat U domain-containing protein [Pseudomonadota bacterium]
MRAWILALLCLLGAGSIARAQTCTVTASGPAFGTADVLLNTAIDTSATITMSCTGGPANGTLRLCLNIGYPAPATAGGNRIAASGANQLSFQLYSDAARSVIWGSWKVAGGGAGVQADLPTNASGATGTVTRTLYARIPAGQTTKPAGTYTRTFPTTSTHYSVQTAGAASCATLTAGTRRITGLSMSATVPSKCAVSNASLDFGNNAALTSLVDASTTIGVTCTPTLPYQIALGQGLGSGVTNPAARKMTKAAETITYGLYRDTARSLPWGWTNGTNTLGGTGTGNTVAVPVYGRVPAQVTPTPGTYTDTVTITVTY